MGRLGETSRIVQYPLAGTQILRGTQDDLTRGRQIEIGSIPLKQGGAELLIHNDQPLVDSVAPSRPDEVTAGRSATVDID